MTQPHIASIGFTCSDGDAIANFYQEKLGFQLLETLLIDGGSYSELIGLPGSQLKLMRLRLGQEMLELTEVQTLSAGLSPGRAIPSDSLSCDLWFQHICIVVNDIASAATPIRQLIATGQVQPISTAPQTLPNWNTAAAGIQAFKFHDPDGHCLELLQFPSDKGEPRWHQQQQSQLFLGIDHSAIAIADTEKSCRFYEQLLGLRLGGDGVNSGIEQDRLDRLSDTSVRITSHRCPEGAGIECLNYQTPASGRPLPTDQNAADLAHWQIRLEVSDLSKITTEVERYGGSLISAGIINLTENQASSLGFAQALQIRDPDGHQLQLVCS